MRRTWAAPLGVVLLAAMACAKESDEDLDTTPRPPLVNEDHWHTAFGIYVCDEFLPPVPESTTAVGIHTHGDGVVHIHPFSEEAAGDGATLDHFLSASAITLGSDQLEVDGEQYDECDGEPGAVEVAWWDSADATDESPEVTTDDFGELRFTADQQAFTIAFVPEGTDVPPPETADELDVLSGSDGPSSSTSSTSDTTLASGTVDPASLDDGFYAVQTNWPDSDAACAAPGVLTGEDGSCYLLLPSGIDADIVESAIVVTFADMPQVNLVLTDDGIDQFNELAAKCFAVAPDCPQGRVAIVVNGRIVSAPSIQQPSFERDQISITGNLTSDEADEIADTLDP